MQSVWTQFRNSIVSVLYILIHLLVFCNYLLRNGDILRKLTIDHGLGLVAYQPL